jgi:cytochrome c-type biogenesis protein CcmE
MKPRHKRFALILGGVAVLGIAAGLVLYALNSNIVFFYTPTQVAQEEAPKGRNFRIGGLVETGSVQREGTRVTFRVTDNVRQIPVAYTGSLPDLFREGKGVVAQGSLGADGLFTASEVLAKHDENYMPPEAAEALRQAGHPVDAAGSAGRDAATGGGANGVSRAAQP